MKADVPPYRAALRWFKSSHDRREPLLRFGGERYFRHGGERKPTPRTCAPNSTPMTGGRGDAPQSAACSAGARGAANLRWRSCDRPKGHVVTGAHGGDVLHELGVGGCS